MTFVRPLAIHNIVLPGDGATTSLGCPWVFAELYKQIWGPGGLSTTWSASLAEDIDAVAVLTAALGSGGTGYTAGDILTVPGGTSTQAATIKVLTEIAGVIDTFEIWDYGFYTVAPSSPAAVTGGTGTGASFNITTGTRPGSYSFMLSRVGAPNDPQLNLRNFATKAAPDTAYAYLGINPDGAADPILSSSSPAGPANFSGTYGQKSWASTTYRYYMVFEYDDAILVCNRNDAGTITAHVMYFGRIGVPRWSADADGGGGVYDHRLDGLGSVGYIPDVSNVVGRWFYYGSSTVMSMLRLALGTTFSSSEAATPGKSWLGCKLDGLKQHKTAGVAAWRDFAGLGLSRFEPVLLALFGGIEVGEMKHIKWMGGSTALQVYSEGGSDYLMCIYHGTSASGFLWVHTTASYDALVLGTYT